MGYNVLSSIEYCKGIVDGFYSFLLYTHIPPTAIALLLAGFILYKNRTSTSARFLLALSVTFALWTLDDLSLWLFYNKATQMMFLWSLIGLLSSLLFVFTFFFIFALVTGRKSVPTSLIIIWTVLLIPVLAATPTSYNLQSFFANDCVAIDWPWFLYYYNFLGLLTALAIPFLPLFRDKTQDGADIPPRNVALFSIIGAEFFLITFLTTNFLASYLVDKGVIPDFSLEQYGLLAMAVFMAFLGYIVTQYKAFNIKLLGAQSLVVALVVPIASELAFVHNTINFYLVLLTLVLSIFFGVMLIRSVRGEVRQRERIEKLAKDLESANARLKELDQLKSEFLSVASHQLRAPITAIRGYASNVIDGSYGAVPEYLFEPIGVMQESARLMASSIEDYLNISRIEQGRMKFEKSTFDVADLAGKVVNELGPIATKRGLDLTFKSVEPVMVNADIGKIKQVISNLADNAIKYTEKGSVSVTAEKVDGKARITIADTGVGIAADEIPKLFTKFTRARDANKVNTTGTGLGLYVAKQLVEGNGGAIRIESDGVGKGSRFIIELPL